MNMAVIEPMRADTDEMSVDILMTAREAYPALEMAVLGAKTRITAGFRIFDPHTHLLSPEGQAVGERWFDLIVDALNRGVSVDLTLSDFDPVMAHDMHSRSWEHLRVWLAANEATNEGAARMTVRVFAHPAAGGMVPRLAFSFRTRKALRKVIESLPGDPGKAARWLRRSPGIRDLIERVGESETVARMRRFALPELRPITLHHKLAVIDDDLTYIGGLDLNERRFDDLSHDQAAQGTWHDVQVLVRNRAVATDARQFLEDLPHVSSRHRDAIAPKSAFRCTLSRARARPFVSLSPERGATTIFESHMDAISDARDLIYLETQYFRDRRLAKALAQAGQRHPDLRLIVLVPAAPEDVAFGAAATLDARFGEHLQVRAMRKMRRAFGPRFFAASPAQPRPVGPQDDPKERASLHGAPIIYVHAKLSIFDDKRAIVSSANLNGRSMSWDAEAGVDLTQHEIVARLRNRVFSHWMDEPEETPLPAAADLFDQFQSRAMRNRSLPPEDRKGFLLPYRIDKASKVSQALPGAPEEMV